MKRHLVAVTTLSVLAGLALELYRAPTYQFPVAMASALGSASALLGLSLGIPAIPAGIYWLVRRQPMPRFTQIAWTVWVVLIVSASYAAYQERPRVFSDSRFSSVIYVPEGCEYLVAFPGTPKTTTFHIPGLREFPRAEYIGGSKGHGLFLRAECISLPKTQRDLLDNKEYLLKQGAAYAKANGLTNAELHYEDTKLGRLVTVRGFKTVAKRPVTFEVHQYLGRRSLLSMYAGGVSTHYPQSAVAEFFASVRIAESQANQ